MNNYLKSKEQRIANRNRIIDSLDYIISESIYYRNHSHLMIESNKVASLSINEKSVRAVI